MSDYLMTDISHADIQSDADRHLELTQPKNDPTALQQAFLWAQKHLPEESEGELYCYSTNSLTPDRRDFSKRRGAWSDHFVSTRVELVSSLIKLTDQPNVDVYVCLSTFDRAERKAQFVARRKTIINDFDVQPPEGEFRATATADKSDDHPDKTPVSGFVEARHFGCFDALSRISADELI